VHPALINSSNNLAFLERMDRVGVQMSVVQAHVTALKPSIIILGMITIRQVLVLAMTLTYSAT
jgi:hypothetical protein